MADDIGSRGEDPRDVARRRRNIGRRLREGQVRAAQSQTSGPSMTPSRQSVVPYQERLPTAPEGGRGGPPTPSAGREMAAPRGENVPAVRREGMPSVRVPSGAADMMRGAMQSPMARAMGTGRAAAGRAAVEGAMRVGERLMRGGRSPAARMPSPDLDEGPAQPLRTMTPGYEEDMYAGSVAGRPAPRPQPVRRPAPRAQANDDFDRRMSELDRITAGAVLSEMMRGGDIQPEERGFFERMGIRRTNETGEGRPSTGSLRGDLEALGKSLGFKKGGMIKPKATMKKGGMAMKYREGGSVRQGMQSPKAQEARAEMAEDVMKRSMPAAPKRRMRDMMSPEDRREYDAPLTPQERERMRESGFKKGGAVKPKAAMKKGGAVKAPAKMMKAGGKVAPKKMMKGGMTSKPKKMMGGGRAMYAKGGMTKGCK